jgi:hypothetical protein
LFSEFFKSSKIFFKMFKIKGSSVPGSQNDTLTYIHNSTYDVGCSVLCFVPDLVMIFWIWIIQIWATMVLFQHWSRRMLLSFLKESFTTTDIFSMYFWTLYLLASWFYNSICSFVGYYSAYLSLLKLSTMSV